ncbi:hypothetical protein BS47DRAFT_395691 [Hydnum rufescens UP504]|uniref:Uncharacterized protein n=1 Tax=Hydnum rufescens UP504 TaxID=1448309 RepID=A0A9P6DM51_9AGAM|nr:hypothetical protein BS47DRAFT_395691 [Hydnum rufescens UP504]
MGASAAESSAPRSPVDPKYARKDSRSLSPSSSRSAKRLKLDPGTPEPETISKRTIVSSVCSQSLIAPCLRVLTTHFASNAWLFGQVSAYLSSALYQCNPIGSNGV